jgi:hypothetical protein
MSTKSTAKQRRREKMRNSIDDTLAELNLDVQLDDAADAGPPGKNASPRELPPPLLGNTQENPTGSSGRQGAEAVRSGGGSSAPSRSRGGGGGGSGGGSGGEDDEESGGEQGAESLDFDEALEALGGFDGVGGSMDFDAQLAQLQAEERQAEERSRLVK